MQVDRIISGDALTELSKLPAGCVDLVFGSPPYEDARTYGIDFNLKGQGWVDWMVEVVQASLRVCKGLVAFVVEGKTHDFAWSGTPALLMADLIRAGVTVRNPPAYYRFGISGSGGPDWLRNDYEPIICATHGGPLPWSDNTAMGHVPKYAPGGEMSHRLSDGQRVNQWGAFGGGKHGGHHKRKDGTRAPKGRPSHKELTKGGMRKANGERRLHGYTVPVIANPGNVIRCKVGGGHMGHEMACENEAPFAEFLAEFFIKSFCPPGGTVLDPFCGSGTTCAMAALCDRHYMGIDIRPSQVELSERRIASTLNPTTYVVQDTPTDSPLFPEKQ